VLDLGAGAGKVTTPIALMGNVASVTAYDLCLRAMKPLAEEINQNHHEYPELLRIAFCNEGYPESLPFDAEVFDVIVCRFAMHHFPDQLGAFKEIHRCLRSGGRLLYSDPAMPQHSRDTTHGLYLLRENNFYGYLTYHEIIDLVTGSGFEITAMRPYGYQRGTLEHYIEAADPILKDHLVRAWCGLDEQTKRELKWAGKREAPFITYPVVDVAAIRK
jgi:SAM-dependent methyltransferase